MGVSDTNFTAVRRAGSRRSGAILLCVLACATVSMALAVIWLHAALQTRREAKRALQLRQAEWLLDAGVRRAVERARDSNDYTGESLQLLPTTSGSVASCDIRIHTDAPPEQQTATQVVNVVVRYGPAEPTTQQIQLSHTFRVADPTADVPPTESKTNES